MLFFLDFGKPVEAFCEATSVSFGEQSNITAGGGSRLAQTHDFVFTKAQNALSGRLMQHHAAGTTINTVSVQCHRDAKSDPHVVYLLTEVVISAFEWGKG